MGERNIDSTRIFSLQTMRELLDQGVPSESVDKDGKTFLRHACGDGRSDIAKFLLDRGADANSRDNEGKTSLMAAAITGRLEIVRLLLEYGADPKIETTSGDSALKIAQRWGKKEIVQALLEKTGQGSVSSYLAPSASGASSERSIPASLESISVQPLQKKTPDSLVPEMAASIPRTDGTAVFEATVRPTAESQTPFAVQTGEVRITTTIIDATVKQPEPAAQQDGFKMPELTIDEYIEALEKMKQSPNDRIGILGSLGATGLGAAAGWGAVATLGATTITGAVTAPVLGSVTLGGWLGAAATTTAVVAAPLTLVIGGAIAAAALGYGISKLISSGARATMIKEMNIKDLIAEIEKRKAAAEKTEVAEEKFKGLVESLQLLVKNDRISQSECTGLIAAIEKGTMSYEYAFNTIERFSKQPEVKTDAQ